MNKQSKFTIAFNGTVPVYIELHNVDSMHLDSISVNATFINGIATIDIANISANTIASIYVGVDRYGDYVGDILFYLPVIRSSKIANRIRQDILLLQAF